VVGVAENSASHCSHDMESPAALGGHPEGRIQAVRPRMLALRELG
jgi:hypothetical protein